jgi:hypothetical protein
MLKRLAFAVTACLWMPLAFGQTPAQFQGLPGAGNAGYPPGSTPLAAAFSGADTTTQAALITAPANQFPYVCGFEVSGLGATGLTQVAPSLTQVSVTGALTFTFEYTFVAGAGLPNTPLQRTFTPCLRGGPTGGSITLNVPGAAGNTSTLINIWGYTE